MKPSLVVLLALVFSSLTLAVSPFELRQMNGNKETYRSKDHRNGVFIIENYFRGCHFCNDNAENVDELAEAFKGDPRVQVLDVGVDRRDDEYKSWIQAHRPNHPVLHDGDKELTEELGTSAYPTTYIVDCLGKVRFRGTGVWDEATKRKLRLTIRKLLSLSCP